MSKLSHASNHHTVSILTTVCFGFLQLLSISMRPGAPGASAWHRPGRQQPKLSMTATMKQMAGSALLRYFAVGLALLVFFSCCQLNQDWCPTHILKTNFNAQVDCTQEMNLCRSHHIQGFPTIRVFRKGHDERKNAHGQLEHESYTGVMQIQLLVSQFELVGQNLAASGSCTTLLD